ncbi:MAG: hypothetical protein CVV27_11775 [Candidatus Melainabacteria bacterium HGW-Melainabacteria-1]|nr:MAG: hypothetical protein CVV27_11775 [Candidatus Melainabacteria bacterium HGW-Melainabacteria-1]
MTMNLPPVSDPVASQPIKAQVPPQAPTPPAAPVAEEPIVPSPQESVELQAQPGSATPTLSLVSEIPDLKAHGEQLFASQLGKTSKTYLRPDDARLASQLKSYAAVIEGNPAMKQAIGRNPRGLDFLHVLEKAATGQKLNRDDVESVQLFLVKDTRFGEGLKYAGDPEGIDGKFGVRTLGALDHFVKNFQPTDLVRDPYYERLDQQGTPYARLE